MFEMEFHSPFENVKQYHDKFKFVKESNRLI